MKRRLLLAILTVAVALPALAVPANGALADRAITWTVNHKARTITVKAKLEIYLGPCRSEIRTAGGGIISTGRDCSATAATIAAAIKADIEGVWNKGHRYKCYLLIFVVDVSVTRSRFTVSEDRIGARVERMRAGIRSHVRVGLNQGSVLRDWESNDPADRLEPGNETFVITEFGYPPSNRHTYAHEFGHILGLHDTYVEGTWEPRPGAQLDLMSRSSRGNIDQSTINRVVERNRDRLRDTKGNAVDLDDLACDLLFRATFGAGDNYYGAIHLMNSGATPPCRTAPFTVDTDQSLAIESPPIDVAVVELLSVSGGYALQPIPDPLAVLGVSPFQFGALSPSYLTLPIGVDVRRYKHRPAQQDIPDVYDLASPGCADSPNGGPVAEDCGIRQYRAWLALRDRDGGLWPSDAGLPPVLASMGSPLQLDRLYRNCTGPTPFPGRIATIETVQPTVGALPALGDLQDVSNAWRSEQRPGRIEITGTVTFNRNEPGSFVRASYTWTLTLCPINSDGDVPPNCPL